MYIDYFNTAYQSKTKGKNRGNHLQMQKVELPEVEGR